MVGSSGAGKTVLVFSELARLPETHSQMVMNFSATTDSGTTQVGDTANTFRGVGGSQELVAPVVNGGEFDRWNPLRLCEHGINGVHARGEGRLSDAQFRWIGLRRLLLL